MTTCAHHWDIEPANGPTSPGVCRNCGNTKEFVNNVDITFKYGRQNTVPFRVRNQQDNAIKAELQIALNLTTDYTRG